MLASVIGVEQGTATPRCRQWTGRVHVPFPYRLSWSRLLPRVPVVMDGHAG